MFDPKELSTWLATPHSPTPGYMYDQSAMDPGSLPSGVHLHVLGGVIPGSKGRDKRYVREMYDRFEAGIYETPYDNFGRLSYEMWRACRLVVDTGMHTMGWSRQQAVDYMMENTALSEHNVNTEIDRYISWPAQALSYKIGEIKIKGLRKKTEKALGERFDVRKFHRAVLENGSVPLFILEQNINTFIEEQKAQ